jgi:hypothetical protein
MILEESPLNRRRLWPIYWQTILEGSARVFGRLPAFWKDILTSEAPHAGRDPDPACDPTLSNLALTLDRVAHVPQARKIIDEIVENDPRAGFLFLWGSPRHALDAFARRLSYLLAEDPDDEPPRRVRLRSTIIECMGFLELGGGIPIRGLKPWLELLPEKARDKPEDALAAASAEADLWVVAFRVPESVREAFLADHCRTLAEALAAVRAWDKGKFLFVYCIDGDRGERDDHPKVAPYPAKVMHDWNSIGAGDIDLWFQSLNRHRHQPALRALDLEQIRIEVCQEICGRDGGETGFMRPALDTLKMKLPMTARWS